MSVGSRIAAGMLVALMWWPTAQAVMPGEAMDDPALEARARSLYHELRCVVCQNQSIDSSDAEIAADLRALVRTRLLAGDDDQAVLDYVVARYGTYVLLEPPVTPLTYGLWFGPPALLIVGAVIVFVWRRRNVDRSALADDEQPLTDDERARLDALLDDREGGQRA